MLEFADSRRRFLSGLGGGFGTLACSALIAKNSFASETSSIERKKSIDPLNPMLPKKPDFKPRCTSVIFLFMVGGPSQIDTFDYKPLLQTLDGKPVPESIRKALEATKHANVFHGCEDKIMASPYKFARHGQTGAWVSELFPHMSKHVDDMLFIHSMQADSNNHAPASYQLHTGDIRNGKASLGSWVTYGLGSESENLPGYVCLFDAGPLGGAANYTNGFLPPAYQPTRLRDQGVPLLDLVPPESLAGSQRASIDAIQSLNAIHRDGREHFAELDARIATYELAYRMQSAALEVGDFANEPEYVHQEYGLDAPEKRTQSFARKCLMARRLVERGVRFVQLYDMPDKDGWDAHAQLRDNHDPRARWTDQPVAALLADLKRRGLLESTLVIWASEFGRTPMMQGKLGRQHNAAGFTLWMAGGGLKSGLHIGSTDEIGLMATERPIQFRELHATILAALGLNHEELFYDVNGRKERLTGVAGNTKPLMDLFQS